MFESLDEFGINNLTYFFRSVFIDLLKQAPCIHLVLCKTSTIKPDVFVINRKRIPQHKMNPELQRQSVESKLNIKLETRVLAFQ